jgi:hypothetical protein
MEKSVMASDITHYLQLNMTVDQGLHWVVTGECDGKISHGFGHNPLPPAEYDC